MNLEEQPERYVEPEVEVWMPRPRRMSRDSVVCGRFSETIVRTAPRARVIGRGRMEARRWKQRPGREVRMYEKA